MSLLRDVLACEPPVCCTGGVWHFSVILSTSVDRNFVTFQDLLNSCDLGSSSHRAIKYTIRCVLGPHSFAMASMGQSYRHDSNGTLPFRLKARIIACRDNRTSVVLVCAILARFATN